MDLASIKDKSNLEVKRWICIYPGRFQIFSPHHYKNYEYLCSVFGSKNVYIATTDKVENPNSPLNFQQKKIIIQKYNVDASRIVKVKSPFSPREITDAFDSNSVAVFLAMGEKDDGRITFQKVDGSPAYIQQIDDSSIIYPFKHNQYIFELPNIQIDIPGFGLMSGTTIRKMILNSSPNFIQNILGWYDDNIINMIKSSIQKMDETINLINCTPTEFIKPIYIL